MNITSHRRHRACAALAAVYAAVLPAVADAQDATIERIEAIERQIHGLQSELQKLRGELGEAKQQLRRSRDEAQRAQEELRQAREAEEKARQDAVKAATVEPEAAQTALPATPAPPSSAPPGADGIRVSMPAGRPTIASSDGRMYVALGTQTQFDVGGYFQNPSPTTQFPHLNNGVNLRRGRIFFSGKFDDFLVQVTPDFGGSPDGSPTLYEANVSWTGFKPVTALVGYYKPYFSLYDSQNSNNFLQLERPSIIEIARNVAAGDARASLGAKTSSDFAAAWPASYFASAYLTGTTFGANTSNSLTGEQLGFVGRLAGRLYHDQDWNVHLDFSGEDVFHPNMNSNTGLPGVSIETLSFSDRPELRIDNNRLISTGNLSASGANVYGGEAGISWRNLLLQGGYYQINMTQAKNPPAPQPGLGFNGGYVEAGWVLTGEPIRYSVGDAAFVRPKVDRPWTLDGPGIGAWELSGRYSAMDLNSHVTPGVAQSVTGGVYGGFQQVSGVLLSWYPNDWVRLELQFQYTSIDKLNAAGTTQIGQNFETLAGRAQVSF